MKLFVLHLLFAIATLACDDCYGPQGSAAHVRNVRRMQPDAQGATVKPRAPLEWGQLNFLQTTDTHGWLAGHIKEQNYGADWGDYANFVTNMRHKASQLGVDLLLIDTGDLHDGSGLSDATVPNGVVSNVIFENIDYDLLTIGNHELYVTDIAYEHFYGFSKVYGERYLTSNVQILDLATGKFEYVGQKYRYFTTKHGLRIMAFGVLFDFGGNSNVSKIIKAADLVNEPWFLDAIKYPEPIDLFILIGHNPVRLTDKISTFGIVLDTVKANRPGIPIQVFGGHTHIRDFAVYDSTSTGIESGRYCETLGWLSLSGIQSSNFNGTVNPQGVPNPSRKAIKVNATATDTNKVPSATASPSNSPELLYSRRYLDWNRLTFAYHAAGSQDRTFDIANDDKISNQVYGTRKALDLTALYGCAPKTYCLSCKPYGADGNIFNLLETAMSETVVNPQRATTPRLIVINAGIIRFDLVKGPFTYDDSFNVSPFKNAFQYIPDVPYTQANGVLDILNRGPAQKRSEPASELNTRDFHFAPLTGEACPDGLYPHGSHQWKPSSEPMTRGLHRRQTTALTPGQTTTDDFGTDGDDTPHSRISKYPQPQDLQANGSLPISGSPPTTVDFIFTDFLAVEYIIPALNSLGGKYTTKDVKEYLPTSFTSEDVFPAYAKKNWQAGLPNCPVGGGVGE